MGTVIINDESAIIRKEAGMTWCRRNTVLRGRDTSDSGGGPVLGRNKQCSEIFCYM